MSAEQIIGHGQDIVRALIRRDVGRALSELQARHGPFVVRDIEGFDTEETAKAVGISPNAVKTRLHRARQALRGLLEPHLKAPTS